MEAGDSRKEATVEGQAATRRQVIGLADMSSTIPAKTGVLCIHSDEAYGLQTQVDSFGLNSLWPSIAIKSHRVELYLLPASRFSLASECIQDNMMRDWATQDYIKEVIVVVDQLPRTIALDAAGALRTLGVKARTLYDGFAAVGE